MLHWYRNINIDIVMGTDINNTITRLRFVPIPILMPKLILGCWSYQNQFYHTDTGIGKILLVLILSISETLRLELSIKIRRIQWLLKVYTPQIIWQFPKSSKKTRNAGHNMAIVGEPWVRLSNVVFHKDSSSVESDILYPFFCIFYFVVLYCILFYSILFHFLPFILLYLFAIFPLMMGNLVRSVSYARIIL